MDLQRINNLWKFLVIKNNLKIECYRHETVTFEIQKGNLVLQHVFNPRFLQQSKLIIFEKNFQENFCHLSYVSSKKRFGFKEKPVSAATRQIFFPKEILEKLHKFDLEIKKDRNGQYKVSIAPFFPKNIYEILDCLNPITRTFWVKNFFAEGIRN
jgi:hypothetical protein